MEIKYLKAKIQNQKKSRKTTYSLYEDKPIFLTYKHKEIIENSKPLSGTFGEDKSMSKKLEEGKEALKEFKPMENYIVINGKKAELTEEQLKQLGIEIEKKQSF